MTFSPTEPGSYPEATDTTIASRNGHGLADRPGARHADRTDAPTNATHG